MGNKLFKKFLRENILILSVSILLLFIFSFLILFSSNRIYIREKNLVLNNEDVLLSTHSLTIKNYFSDIYGDLNFLISNPVTLNYINSGYNSKSAEKDLIDLLSNF